MSNFRADWSWQPDSSTRNRISDGNRKCRRPELSPQRLEEMKMKLDDNTTSAASDSDDTPRAARKSAIKKPVRKVTKKVAAKKANGDGHDPNLVPLKTLCKDLKVDPRMARRKLRKAKISGHSERDRWAFKKGSSQLDKAKEVLSAAA